MCTNDWNTCTAKDYTKERNLFGAAAYEAQGPVDLIVNSALYGFLQKKKKIIQTFQIDFLQPSPIYRQF